MSEFSIEELKEYKYLRWAYFESSMPTTEFNVDRYHELSKKFEGVDVLGIMIDHADKLQKALDVALGALKANSDEDYRGNRSTASVRSFRALTEIQKIVEGD